TSLCLAPSQRRPAHTLFPYTTLFRSCPLLAPVCRAQGDGGLSRSSARASGGRPFLPRDGYWRCVGARSPPQAERGRRETLRGARRPGLLWPFRLQPPARCKVRERVPGRSLVVMGL